VYLLVTGMGTSVFLRPLTLWYGVVMQVAAEDGVEKDENLLDFTPLFNLDVLYKALLTLK